MYQAYADEKYYLNRPNALMTGDVRKALQTASRHIDTLTYNRIHRIGWDNLTDFQKEIIQEVVCKQADFEYENSDMIQSVLSGYSLNGASVQFGSGWNMVTQNGVAMQRDVYSLLEQTGLCCRVI